MPLRLPSAPQIHPSPTLLPPPSSQSALELSKCSICHGRPSPYTCPSCNIPYCSLSCFRNEQKHGGCLSTFQNRIQKEHREASRRNLHSDDHDDSAQAERTRILDIVRRSQAEQDDERGAGIDYQAQLDYNEEEEEEASQSSNHSDSTSPCIELTEATLPSSTSDLLAMLSKQQRDIFFAAVGQQQQQAAQGQQDDVKALHPSKRHQERAKKLWEKIVADEQVRSDSHDPAESDASVPINLWWLLQASDRSALDSNSLHVSEPRRSTFHDQVSALLAARSRKAISSFPQGPVWNCLALLTAYTYILLHFDIPSLASLLVRPSSREDNLIRDCLNLLYRLSPFLFALPAPSPSASTTSTTSNPATLLLTSPTEVTAYLLARLGDQDRSSQPSKLILELYTQTFSLLDRVAISQSDDAETKGVPSKASRALEDIWQLVEYTSSHSTSLDHSFLFASSIDRPTSNGDIRRSLQQASRKLLFYSATCASTLHDSHSSLLSSPTILGSIVTGATSTDTISSLSSLSLQGQTHATLRPHRLRSREANDLAEEIISLQMEVNGIEEEERWEAARRLEEERTGPFRGSGGGDGSGSGEGGEEEEEEDKVRRGKTGNLIQAVDQVTEPQLQPGTVVLLRPIRESRGKVDEEVKAEDGRRGGGVEDGLSDRTDQPTTTMMMSQGEGGGGIKSISFVEKRLARKKKEEAVTVRAGSG